MSFLQRLLRAAPYHASFLTSINHAWLALVTLAVGIAVATPLSIAIGLGAYGLGVIFFPDLPIFRKRYDAKRQAEVDARAREESDAKRKVRDGLLKKLSTESRKRWENFSAVCVGLQAKLNEDEGAMLLQDNSLTKVADSHLLLLGMDADIREYLRSADSAKDLVRRSEEIRAELEELHRRTELSDVEQRLILSKEETLRNLQQQVEQNRRMELNLELAQSELQRLESQISFLKAELISNPAGLLSNRLSDTLTQVGASQRVLQEGGMVNAPDLTTLLGESA